MELTSEQIRLLMMHDDDDGCWIQMQQWQVNASIESDLLPEKWQEVLEVERECFDY
ncbi:hypothetical protein KIN20_028432 [Parelaphostrongylus tenuis]|uniref:Uncharacterized protein n=1 Tax=Parelaphostrongylus tenuis TaxID=148309 RepID=A0AAD5R187_PARTN|nr:hypothetical protein KIN20_028432 [Parelaphostrongylus tenuis]